MLSGLPSKMIVYIQEFDKYDNSGKLLCRNTNCTNHPVLPYKKYCSDIFRRDGYTCQICKKEFLYKYRRKFVRSANLECDHIIPRSSYQQLGYKYDTLENKIKVTIEFFHNHSNLRTVCRDCHKQVTSTFLSNKFKKEGQEIILENS
jgi:5-methylcytosine-specific restriction endonuclease McrA